jgi:hypothetical protein
MADNGEIQPVSLRENTPRDPLPNRDPRSRALLYGFGIMLAGIVVVVLLFAASFAASDGDT